MAYPVTYNPEKTVPSNSHCISLKNAAMFGHTMKVFLDLIKQRSTPLEPINPDYDIKLQNISGIRAIIFDVYGTLFVSGSGDISLAESKDRETAMRDAFTISGYEVHADDYRISDVFHDLIKQSHSRRHAYSIEHPEVDIRDIWLVLLQKLIRNKKLKGQQDPLSIQKLAITYECSVNPVWPMPGLQSLLEHLRNGQQVLGIISNAQFFTPLLFEALLGKNLAYYNFQKDCCIWSYEYLEAKPSRDLFQNLAEYLAVQSIPPSEILYVGNDMRNDIAPAQKAGYKTALFAGDKRSLRLRENDPSCKGVVPDLVINNLEQILECCPTKAIC